MYIVSTVHLDFICIKLFWILNLWHPHPTTGQVLQSSPTPDLISEEEELNNNKNILSSGINTNLAIFMKTNSISIQNFIVIK